MSKALRDLIEELADASYAEGCYTAQTEDVSKEKMDRTHRAKEELL